ncbi:MAG: modulator protein [Rhodospirillaceae bacterium]|jgi:PmbA protein|uniref:TldD/PmbA family protein n=1 Tax=Hwanghaeella sp. 1Z406 TaxID=3402811 RepID=UPI000C59494D|nr:modulator protein [Rhodospirillales bacterium]MAX48166.1 modulator protein [Rhodospirillaceae bacterium]|tara:strand:+ start:115754 stop:117100 length:1347 start_codon:yes stop_codon:yes gene_type:complete
MTVETDPLVLIQDLVERALKAGADSADAVAGLSTSISHAQRLGKTEKLERQESQDLGLRVLIGKRQAIVSSNDWKPDGLALLVERAIAMAKTVPEDSFCGIADPDQIVGDNYPKLEMFDPQEPSAETLIARATETEDAALAVAGITNSEGAEASWGQSRIALAASNGFAGRYQGSNHSIAVSVLAGTGTAMESDYDYSSAIFGSDLTDPVEIGRSAADRALKKLGARKPPSAKVPVVFDPRVSGGLVRHLTSAINGAAIARGTSFLKDKMGQAVMSSGITIVDDPHRARGLASKPFDAEGLANKRRNLVENGILQTWILDLRAARQLGLTSTGHASRGTSSPPSPSTTNLHLETSTVSPTDLISDIKSGFYITSVMGMGVNMVTGDYSRGASGFWIENGQIAYPVNEVTIAGNLMDMFLAMTPADDLDFKYATNAPTIRIDGMMVAGT